MCTTCGCGTDEVKIEGGNAGHGHGHEHVHADGTRHSHEHGHDPAHENCHEAGEGHGHSHAPGISATRRVQIEQDILSRNNAYAHENRQHLAGHGIFALNLVSGPGSGKTTLLCKTITMLAGLPVAVIEGDQQTSMDAERIRATGAPAVQINTGKGCHLDAHMVGHAMSRLALKDDSLLMIENVGQPGLPRRLRPGRGAQGGHPVGDGGRGQAHQVPGHVPRGQRDAAQQDRPAARTWTLTWRPPWATPGGSIRRFA
jgi:hydrogenase nickel incorporation protein HypB